MEIPDFRRDQSPILRKHLLQPPRASERFPRWGPQQLSAAMHVPYYGTRTGIDCRAFNTHGIDTSGGQLRAHLSAPIMLDRRILQRPPEPWRSA
jgi:hypothetical protein